MAVAKVVNQTQTPVPQQEMTWQQKLEQVKTDHDAGYAAIADAGQKYNTYKAAGQTQQAEAAHTWANQLRDAMGIADQHDRTTGALLQPKPQAPLATDPVNADAFRSQGATIDDIAAKYGFDFSREYAGRQAEAEAQAKRNAINQGIRGNESANQRNKQAIDQGVYNASDALDGARFLAQQDTNQQQTLTGVNAGIAGDQNLRLAMNAQNQMGKIFGDANLARTDEQSRFTNEALRLMEGLALTEQEKLAYAERLFNERLMQGAGLTMQENQMNQNWDMASLNAALQQRGQNINIDQFNQSFDWNKAIDEANMTGQFKGQQTTAEMQRLFANDLATQSFNRPYEELTAYEKAQIDSQAQANAARASSGGGGGGNLFSLNATQFDSVQKAYQNGSAEQKAMFEAIYPELKLFAGSNADEKVFLQGLNPKEDTYETVNAEIMAAHAAGQMTSEQVLKYQSLAQEYFNAIPKAPADPKGGSSSNWTQSFWDASPIKQAWQPVDKLFEKAAEGVGSQYQYDPNETWVDRLKKIITDSFK